MKSNYQKYSLLVLGTLVLLLYVFFTGKKKQEVGAGNYPQNYSMNLPAKIQAGTSMCSGYSEWMEGCEVIVENSWGIALQKIIPQGNLFCFADSIVLQTGLYNVRLICDGNIVAHQLVNVLPLPPTEPLEVYLGSKSITADGGKHWAMITAIPVDSLLNPVYANTKVEFDFYRPNESREIKSNYTSNLVAYQKIFSGPKVGKTIVGSRAGGAIGQEKVLLEEAGYPTNFNIKATEVYPFADQRQFFTIESSEVTDEFGNTVADGTLVTFVIIDADNTRRQLTGYTIEGKISLAVQNPVLSGKLKVRGAIFGNVTSNELELNFERIIDQIPVRYEKSTGMLHIGPLIASLGQYVADGSEVEVEIMPTNVKFTAVVLNGQANVNTGAFSKGVYSINFRFGGIEKQIKFRK